MKRILGLIILLLVVLLFGMVLKTIFHPFAESTTSETTGLDIPELTSDQIQRFSRGIQIATVSDSEYSKTNFLPFKKYIQFLKQNYPLIFQKMNFYTINDYGLILHWKGRDSNLKPLLFLSHYDVVAPGDPDGWKAPAFSGKIKDGKIYGRGTLDMKNMLHGLLEASTNLLEKEFQPERDVYFAFGQDEEVGGLDGALIIAEHFKSEGISFDSVFDEGGIVVEAGSIKGVDADIALIGVAEKGFLSARITVKGLGGHSSMPPLESAMGKAARIMLNLEKNQFPSRIIPSIENFLNQIGGSMGFSTRFAIANLWIMKPILLNQLSKNPATNAITRTTTALTMMKGSDGTNVLSPEVEFVANFRLLPGETIDDVKKHIDKAAEGYDIEIEEVSNTRNPSKVSSTDTHGYKILKNTVRKIYPKAIISPYITIGGTDAFKYEIVSENIYRFNPILLNSNEQRSIHNQNEYISLENYKRTIFFFETMLKNYDETLTGNTK
ncbi:MAG: M20/M25/M40 family metallo-hydrolase [Leptospira sp.]|nr:M20/M25/M40 family metallo-hydrolase [Leptospira sp.]